MDEVCKEYGGGLYLLAAEINSEKVFFDELMALKGVLCENSEYVKLLSSPALSASEKKELVREAFSGKLHEYVVNFMQLLCERGYFASMLGCIDAYKKLYYEKCNITEGTVKSAYALSDSEKERLKTAIEAKLGKGKTLILEFITDESLIGGFLVEIDGNVVDSTIKTKLSGLKNVLSK